MDPGVISAPARGKWALRAVLGFLLLLAATPAFAAGGAATESVAESVGNPKAAEDSATTDTEGSGTALTPAPIVGPSAGQHLVFVEGGIRQDLGTLSRRDVVGDNVMQNQDEVDTFHSMFQVGFLERLATGVRFGGAFGYGGNYNYSGNNLIGQLLTFDMRVELGIPLSAKWGLFGTPRAGLSLLIPAGELLDRILTNQDNGFDTWSGPRYGFLVGADIGARYALTPWLSARGSVGYAWFINLLLNTHAENGGVSASQSWTLQASRLSANLGLEVTF